MTDEQIIKALERCYSGCDKDCPWYSDDDFCMFKMQQQAADLINRQKAEIERLEGILGKRCDVCPVKVMTEGGERK